MILRLPILLSASSSPPPSHAVRCGGDYNAFVSSISAEAAASGIAQSVISQALSGVQQDMGVLAFDRRQRGTF